MKNYLEMDEAEKARRMDSLRFQIDELERAQLVPGEEESLTERRDLLRNGEKYLSALSGADYCLNGGEEGGGAVSALRDAEEALAGVRTLSGDMGELYQRLEQLRCEAYDLAEIIRDKREAFDFSPAELDAAIARMDTLDKLKKKYGDTLEDVLSYRDRIASELHLIENFDEQKKKLEQELLQAKQQLDAACRALTDLRCQTAAELAEKMEAELVGLNFADAKLTIAVEPLPTPSENGADRVEILVSTNKGQPLKPLAKIASGGEMSRIMLALKNIISSYDRIPTLIFDEIDSGISGRTAQMVSEKMNVLGRSHQIICITHLPQIAAMADSHYLIQKSVQNQTTVSTIRRLSEEESVQELSRMLGGVEITETVKESAREMRALAKSKKSGFEK